MAQVGFPGIVGYYVCDACGSPGHERVFTDSWTGMDLCLECAHPAAYRTTMSPQEEGDNLKQVLREEGRLNDEKEEVHAE